MKNQMMGLPDVWVLPSHAATFEGGWKAALQAEREDICRDSHWYEMQKGEIRSGNAKTI